jgi:hypothetical protein
MQVNSWQVILGNTEKELKTGVGKRRKARKSGLQVSYYCEKTELNAVVKTQER